jgi:hypothetical protein
MPELQIPEHTLHSYDELLGSAPCRPALERALPALLKQLKLAQFSSQCLATKQEAAADGWTPAIYLYVLAEQEHQPGTRPGCSGCCMRRSCQFH